MNFLDTLAQWTGLRPIDRALAELLYRKESSKHRDTLALTAALISSQRSSGHSCMALSDWAHRSWTVGAHGEAIELPEAQPWTEQLESCELVSDGSRWTPLVLNDMGLLYLYRDWRAEQDLAQSITARLTEPLEAQDWSALKPTFQTLFPKALDATDGQALAAASALLHRFCIVTGGPGTGKTTTVARILALLLARHPDLRIELAAPTGKAAARMSESLKDQIEQLNLKPEMRARVPLTAKTLHRLLGYDPQNDRFRYNAQRPLPADLVVVDEASMVDLLLMNALFSSLLPRTRIILLGDKDQLASVETGYVLGDLCKAARLEIPTSGSFAKSYTQLCGWAPEASGEATALRDAAAELKVSYRFKDQPGIGALATAIREGDSSEALRVLEDEQFNDVMLAPHPQPASATLQPLMGRIDAYLQATSPGEALERLLTFRILCPTRSGPWGVDSMTQLVEVHLSEKGRRVVDTWYHGRPIMVTANDYHVNLFNGDIGVCWAEEDNTVAWFPDPDKGIRRMALAKLPPHETCWAMTVHKSQGSEFDHVLLPFPDRDSRVLTRELFYTGVTRAKKSIHLYGPASLVEAAVGRSAERTSGLARSMQRMGLGSA